ncbi:response regulator transcription factor [Clostridium sp.]|uniref:response regulator transcription factor n=1 Tax=Clostridium sp. TaxID=1506 RepID=UPI003F3A53E5
MKILVVEDEIDLRNALSKGLRKSNYTVDTAKDGEEAIYISQVNNYDLMILDLNLPKRDGIEVLREIRKNNNEIKVIILTSRGDIEDRVQGLDEGANDYLMKPFYFDELNARIRALLRRNFIQKNNIITCGILKLNILERNIYILDNKLELTKSEFQILEYLILNKNTYVSTEKIMESVFGDEKSIFSNSIKVHINSIRKKIGRYYNESDIIKNKREVGYFVEDENCK